MTRGLSFSESFWDTDINGTSGWDTLCRRMKDGKKVCSDVAHYLKDRAKAESEYSKSLMNIAKKADGKEETGILGDGWRFLKQQTEKIAIIHEQASTHFNALQEELYKFNDEQSRTKKQTEENVKKYIQSKKNEYQKTMSLKKSYEQKCQDYNNAEETHKTLSNSVTVKRGELEKASSKCSKSKESKENADLAYKSGVESLESVRKKWEEETETACKQLEEMEVSRLDCLRDKIWKCTNVDSLACIRHDDCSEAVRTVLANCDIDEDLQNFMNSSKTGSKRPAPIEYENYYTGTAPQSPLKSSGFKMPAPNRPAKPLPTRPPRKDIDEGHYASVDISAVSPSSKILLVIVRSHIATNPSELDVRVGDKVELIKQKNRQNMITVKYPDQKRIGVIPEDCAKAFT